MLIVSVANSIHFVIQDNNLPNRENTLSYNEKFGSWETKLSYCQKFDELDVATVQCVSETSALPVVRIYDPALTLEFTATLVNSFDSDPNPDNHRFYFEFDINFALFPKRIRIEVEQNGVIWESEYCLAIDMETAVFDGDFLKLEYTNQGQPSAYPNFQIDYTTGIQFFFYIEAVMREPDPQGDDEFFTGIESKQLLEAQVFRGHNLQTAPIPRFLQEKIHIASKHFLFVINSLQHEAEGVPEVEISGGNFVTLTYPVVQKDTIAFSTDDRGLTPSAVENPIQTFKTDNLTSTWSFTIPAGFALHFFLCNHAVSSASASYQFKAGYTIGGSEIIIPQMTNVVNGGVNETYTIHEQIYFDTAVNVYVELFNSPGTVAQIWVNIIKNK